jgi:hypothetical protein
MFCGQAGVVADFTSNAYVPCFMHGIQWMITVAGFRA